MSLQCVKVGVARAVFAFNENATELITVVNLLYVDITYITLGSLEQKVNVASRKPMPRLVHKLRPAEKNTGASTGLLYVLKRPNMATCTVLEDTEYINTVHIA